MSDGNFFYYEPAITNRFSRRVRRRQPVLTYGMLAACTLIFIMGQFIDLRGPFSFVPVRAFAEPWTFITSVFLHASPDHLLFNMFALFVFGIYLETRISPAQYLTVFIAAGILGNVAYLITDPLSVIPAVGASGSIYGIMGMLAILYPGLVVYVFYAPMPMIFAAVLWFMLEFFGLFVPSDIAHQAHLAGLLLGAAYGYYIRRGRGKVVFFWER